MWGLQPGQYEPLQDLGDCHEVRDRAVVRRVVLVRSGLLQQRDHVSQLETGGKNAGGERQVGQVSQRRGEDVRTLLQDHRGDGIEWRYLALHGSVDSEHLVCRNRLKLLKPWRVEEWNIDERPTEGGQPGGDVRSDPTQLTNEEVFEAGAKICFLTGVHRFTVFAVVTVTLRYVGYVTSLQDLVGDVPNGLLITRCIDEASCTVSPRGINDWPIRRSSRTSSCRRQSRSFDIVFRTHAGAGWPSWPPRTDREIDGCRSASWLCG